jgi:hypothetical protein
MAPLIAAALALGPLATGCGKKPEAGPARPETDPATGMPVPTHSLFIGQWVGRDRKGDTYGFTFTRGTWESYVEKDGARLRHYRGTYTHDGGSLALRVTEKGDRRTGEWAKEGGNLPDGISGRLVGSVLRITTLTDADLIKR